MQIPFDRLGLEPVQPLRGIDSLHFVFENSRLPQVICTAVTVDLSTAPIPVTPEGWRQHLIRRCLRLPFLHRVYQPMPFGRGAWVHTPDLDLDYHFPEVTHDGPLTDKVRTSFLAKQFKKPLDPAKPLWEITTLRRTDGPEVTIYVRLHHSQLDGMFAFSAFSILFDPTEETPDRDEPAVTPEVIREVAATDAKTVRRLHRRAWLACKLDAVRDVVPLIRDLRAASKNKKQVLADSNADPAQFPPSSCGETSWGRAKPSGELNVAWGRVPSPVLSAIGRPLGASFVDVVLGAATAAFRAKLIADGITPTKPMACGYPVSTRQPPHQLASGNQTGSYDIPLPVHLDDTIEQIRFVKAARKLGKKVYDAGDIHLQERTFRYLPMRVAKAAALVYDKLGLARHHTQLFDTFATFLPMPFEKAYILGAEVTDSFSTSALNNLFHCELMGTRNREMVRLAFASDPQVFPDGDLFMESLLSEIHKLNTQITADEKSPT